MITDRPISSLKTDVERQLIDGTIEFIHRHGVESVSFRQLAAYTDIKTSIIIDRFHNVNNLIAICLQFSFDKLGAYLLFSNAGADCASVNIEWFWKLLVDFNQLNVYKSALICHYLKKPSLFPLIAVKDYLSVPVSRIFERTHHQIKASNKQIRFVVFAYLFQVAYRAARIMPYCMEINNQKYVYNYFYNNIDREVNILLKLPIC